MADKVPDLISTGNETASKSDLNAPNPGPAESDAVLSDSSASHSVPEQASSQKGKSTTPVRSSASPTRNSKSPTRNDKDAKSTSSVDKEPQSSAGNDIADSGDMGSDTTTKEKPAPTVRDNTMMVTAKEGAALLTDQHLEGTRSGTRNVKKATDASAETSPKKATDASVKKAADATAETSPKKAPVRRDHTIQAVVKEAATIIGTDVDSMPRLRSAASKKPESPQKPARDSTMKRTAQEGKALLGETPPAKRTRGK